MADEKRGSERPQNLILEQRKRLLLSGVREVVSFDEKNVIAQTSLGRVVIRGEGLQVSRLNPDTEELLINGRVSLIAYTEESHSGRGFLSKLFR